MTAEDIEKYLQLHDEINRLGAAFASRWVPVYAPACYFNRIEAISGDFVTIDLISYMSGDEDHEDVQMPIEVFADESKHAEFIAGLLRGRIEERERSKAEKAQHQEKQERAELARLKEKYEGRQ